MLNFIYEALEDIIGRSNPDHGGGQGGSSIPSRESPGRHGKLRQTHLRFASPSWRPGIGRFLTSEGNALKAVEDLDVQLRIPPSFAPISKADELLGRQQFEHFASQIESGKNYDSVAVFGRFGILDAVLTERIRQLQLQNTVSLAPLHDASAIAKQDIYDSGIRAHVQGWIDRTAEQIGAWRNPQLDTFMPGVPINIPTGIQMWPGSRHNEPVKLRTDSGDRLLSAAEINRRFNITLVNRMVFSADLHPSLIKDWRGRDYREELFGKAGPAEVLLGEISRKIGAGIFAGELIEEGRAIDVYWGFLHAWNPINHLEMMKSRYSASDPSFYYIFDATFVRGLMAFANSSEMHHNAVFKTKFIDGVPHLVVTAIEDIGEGAQILLPYTLHNQEAELLTPWSHLY